MNNRTLITILFLLILLTVLIFSFLYYLIKKQIKNRESYTIYLFGKKRTHNIYLVFYDFFSQWSLTRKYIKIIAKTIQIYNAGEFYETNVKTMKLAIKIWTIDVILIVAIYIRNPSVYTFVIFLMYLLIINKQIFYRTLDKGHLILLKQLDNYLGDVRHNFQIHGMIDEAIFDSLKQTDKPMHHHGQKIYDILNASDIPEEVAKYNEVTPNRFLKLFLSLCVMMITYGDKKLNGKSLFLTNLKYLRQELNIEILYRERMNHVFSGLIVISLTPVLFLKVIENWAVQSLPEMEEHYKSLAGILTLTGIFLITYASYILINKLKENSEYEKKTPIVLDFLSNLILCKELLTPILNKNYSKTLRIKALLLRTGEPYTNLQFFIKQILFGVFGLILCTFLSIFIHWNNKDQLLNNYNHLNYLNSSLSASQVLEIQELMKNYLFYYKEKGIEDTDLETKIKAEGVIKNKQYIGLIAEEIYKRLKKYNKEYYQWYELLISLLISTLFYQIPYLYLLCISKLREKNMEEEITQYHTIILMLIHIDRVTVEMILEWLEYFAVIFKCSIEQLRNEIQNGEIEILEELRQKETYGPFVKIIENLQISDRIGIERAFDEVEMDRLNYQEKRKMDNEINIQDKASLGRFFAFIPFMITTGLYLILPFIIKGMTTFMGYMDQMNRGT